MGIECGGGVSKTLKLALSLYVVMERLYGVQQKYEVIWL